nr:MAG TPA: hypothetical protein [Bacteriophage sp.]
MYIGEPFSWKPTAFEGGNGIMSITSKETTAHGRVVYINEAHRYFTAEAVCVCPDYFCSYGEPKEG